MLASVPNEILFRIAKYCLPAGLSSLARTSLRLHGIFNHILYVNDRIIDGSYAVYHAIKSCSDDSVALGTLRSAVLAGSTLTQCCDPKSHECHCGLMAYLAVYSPICLAANFGREMLLQFLLDNGIPADGPGTHTPSPLFLAIQGGHETTASILALRGARLNQEFRDLQDETLVPVHIDGYGALILSDSESVSSYGFPGQDDSSPSDVLQKLEALSPRVTADSFPDAVIRHYMEKERLSTEKALQFCNVLSEQIEQIQTDFQNNQDPDSTSEMLFGEGLQGCMHHMRFTLARLEERQKSVAERLGSGFNVASAEEQASFDKLRNEAKTLRHCLAFCSDVDTYAELQISNIENHAEGDDTIQFLVSTNSKPITERTEALARGKSRLADISGKLPFNRCPKTLRVLPSTKAVMWSRINNVRQQHQVMKLHRRAPSRYSAIAMAQVSCLQKLRPLSFPQIR
ncbi:hypothetical protein V2G26_007278 [Clonostachys chloroleuca]